MELLADLIYCANLNVAAFLANGLFGVFNNNLTLMLKNMKCWKMLSTTHSLIAVVVQILTPILPFEN